MSERLTDIEIEAIVERTVQRTLLTLGIDTADALEHQRDLQWLRDWRKSAKAAQTYGLRAAIGILVAGALGALWLGIQNVISGK